MSCPVFLHVGTHTFVKLLSVFGFIHVDEVHHDDTTISLSLSWRASSSAAPDSLPVRWLLPVGILGAVTAVHVYYVKRLSMLNNQVGTTFV